MTEITDIVNVTVNVADTRISRAGFGVPLILDEFPSSIFSDRVREYTSLDSVADDFATTSKVYKAAAAIFSQSRVPARIKVGRKDAGDADITTALNTITDFDDDWYGLIATFKDKADIEEIAAWVETQDKIFVASSEDSDVITNVDTDVASALKAAGYNRTAYQWHHEAGVDVTGASYTVTGGVATITEVGHGLKVGDPVTFSNSSGASIDGNNTVATVVDADNFTVETTAADEAGPATVDYFARYTFPEAAWVGYMLPSDPGSETWKFKQLTGISPVPRDSLTPSEEADALGKYANLYTRIAGVGATHEGVMASGRYIDIQRGIDWLEARIGEAVVTRLLNEPKVPYSDAGGAVLEGEIAAIMDEGVRRNVLGALLDDTGDFYRITVPSVSSQSVADRQNRLFSGITAEAQMAGAIHKLAITVNAQV